MDDLIKRSIEARKNAILNSYEIDDDNMLHKIDKLFNKINKFGAECIDISEFESKFAVHELNSEYTNLFTEIAMKFKSIIKENEIDSTIKSDKEMIIDEITSEVKYQAESITQPLRRQATQEVYDKVRDIPVVEDILNVKQHVDFFSKFKKKKEDK